MRKVIHYDFIFVFIVVIMMLLLAYWQFNKAYKVKQFDQTKSTIYPQFANKDNLIHGQRYKLNGQIRNQPIWLLDNRHFKHKKGYEVLTIFSSMDKKYLINLGWTQNNLLINGSFNIENKTFLVKNKDIKGFTLATEETNYDDKLNTIQYIDIAEINKKFNLQLEPQLLITQENITPFFANYKMYIISFDKHFSYGIQWILLAASLVSIYYLSIFKHRRKLNAE